MVRSYAQVAPATRVVALHRPVSTWPRRASVCVHEGVAHAQAWQRRARRRPCDARGQPGPGGAARGAGAPGSGAAAAGPGSAAPRARATPTLSVQLVAGVAMAGYGQGRGGGTATAGAAASSARGGTGTQAAAARAGGPSGERCRLRDDEHRQGRAHGDHGVRTPGLRPRGPGGRPPGARASNRPGCRRTCRVRPSLPSARRGRTAVDRRCVTDDRHRSCFAVI